ncbi:N-acyl homoserine lactonase family protein, partial [bacterium]|nr:N-acyl homoserine lactonase family protein [bacterium]
MDRLCGGNNFKEREVIMRGIKSISILALTLLVLMPVISPNVERAFGAEKAPEYQVYIVHYGTSDSYPMPYLMYLASAAENVPMDWAFWVIKGDDRVILVDTGCSEKMAKQWNVKGWVRSDQAIKKLGIKPDEVTDIIVTHMHWDHVNNCNLDYFPNVKIWIQKSELAFVATESGQNPQARIGIQKDEVLRMVRYNWEGRVQLMDGTTEMYPGVTCHLFPRTHTFGSQAVTVNTASGTVVIAQDLVYGFDNIEKMTGIGTGLDMYECYKALVAITKMAS